MVSAKTGRVLIKSTERMRKQKQALSPTPGHNQLTDLV